MFIINNKNVKTLLIKLLSASFFLISQSVFAVSSIEISVDSVEAPIGQLKSAQFHVDLKGKEPKLTLAGEVKPKNESDFTPFQLKCGTLLSEQIGYIDCFDGAFTSNVISAPFSLHLAKLTNQFSLDILFNGANFSDAEGLHAGENLIGDMQLSAQKKNKTWQWEGKVSWDNGEVFWQPFYFGKAGNVFKANGTVVEQRVNVDDASLVVNDVGEIKASAEINFQTKALEDLKISADDVDFSGLYTLILKPKLEKSAFGNLLVSGQASWQFEMKNLQPTSFELNLNNANIEDQNGKFAFRHVNAHIPWDYDVAKNITLNYQNGYLLNIPLGETKLKAELNRYSLTATELELPMLNGALNFKDVSAAWLGENWFWHLRMDLKPISLSDFSLALGWPQMQGEISGQVPLVTYANKQLNMDGAMTFNMFNGTVSMNNLRIDDPLGVVTRMYADLNVRRLDLGELTRTYSFGAIQGKLDGDVNHLVLENWKPVYFDASLKTSDDEQEKKISQRAVENIAALGGQGTAAALQRTFLRFFDEFNYDKIGISCKLRRDVCEMGGVESTPQGYIIVKGSGIPAVNVNGYTKYVSLLDLLARIKRITDSNSTVVVE
jgi:hypothetical protein